MKKSKKKIVIVLIVCIYILGLVIGNVYIRNEYDITLNNISAFVVYGKEKHEELFNSTEGVVSYRRALSFNAGEDNDIIYVPEEIELPDGSKRYKDGLDQTKINWNSLSNIDNKIILTYKASTCGVELSKDEVVIKLSSQEYDEQYISRFRGSNVTFNFNDKLVPLRIKDVMEPEVYSFICIANELYDELVIDEENYIYDVEMADYKTYENLKYEWSGLENNSFFGLYMPTSLFSVELSNKVYNLGNLINFLNLLNIISGLILILSVIGLVLYFLVRFLNKEL